MRGRSSSAKSRLRSAGYKCNLCGRRVIDAATLERHQKTIHNVSRRVNKLGFKSKPVQRAKLNNKFKEKSDSPKQEMLVDLKPKSKDTKTSYEELCASVMEGYVDEEIVVDKEVEVPENGENVTVEKEKKCKKKENKEKDKKDSARRVGFECPVCAKTFNVYFTAHRHIQKMHSINAEGKIVEPNAMDLVQPIRVEKCYRCEHKMRSTEPHICPKLTEEPVVVATEYVCSGCNQGFITLKMFDLHVAAMHSDAVDSMFFPSKIEFINWRLEMERETDAKYSLHDEYESKKVYHCSYARKHMTRDKNTAYFCPSSIVLQEFSKGIQVHYFNSHYDHAARPYKLSSKYKKYSITSFLKNPDDSVVSSPAFSMKLEDEDLHSQFKKLMDSIVLNSNDSDVPMLKVLIEKALEMSTVLTEGVVEKVKAKPSKSMSDKEITEALQKKTLPKRRRSVDSCEAPLKAARRTRNKSLVTESDAELSPKILNTFSLASNSDDDFELESSSESKKRFKTKNNLEVDEKKNKSKDAKSSRNNDSPSFNDSYKDFIDKNFIGRMEKDAKSIKSKVKTKLGVFKQTSPRKENKDSAYDADIKNLRGIKPIKRDENVTNIENPESDKNLRGIKPINKVDETCTSMEYSKTNLDKLETPEAVSRSQITPEQSPKINALTNTSDEFSDLADPLELDIPHTSGAISLMEPREHRRLQSPGIDPLEMGSPTTAKNVAKLERDMIASTRKFPSPVDPLQINPDEVIDSKDKPALNSAKITPKSDNIETLIQKPINPKVYPGRVAPKLSSPETRTSPKAPKVSFQDAPAHASPKIPKYKIKELKYEVREQENDCNILILKF